MRARLDVDAVPDEEREGWSRRRWVKAAAIAGVGGAAAAAGALTLTPLSRGGERPPKFKYVGVKVLGGSQAPRGIPIIPVRTNAAGELEGVPKHLEWYRYCGRNNAPGLSSGFATDNVFRYNVTPSVLADTKAEGIDAWYEGRLGQPALREHFDEVGKGAPAVWRSEGQESTNPLTCLLVRIDIDQLDPRIATEFVPDGIVGVFATCAHLCCVPTWRASRVGYGEGHWDDITCHCHGSWYNPRELAEYDFPPTG